ncbi:CD3324 family protein [Clostridium chromiireducens]|uniref:Mor transcription activator family protein n=1 Tax=Clostridium chromiireducens TaxID=225345 RepID=A0A1V4IHJ1_9CLOT|nr:CD3324 family protein [Clostridium chromiireducens]OPJ59320.1 Mor transcription activator family protein [Clostridium chromiireducens]
MCYKNGKDILPEKLLRELQKYIQGETIYIPKNEERKGWGENNGTRLAIRKRNMEIYNLYKEGIKISNIAQTYNLSEDSIRKIVFKLNNEILKLSCKAFEEDVDA